MRPGAARTAFAADGLPEALAMPAEVFRSRRRRPCDERAFMLTAVGIASAVEPDGRDWVMRVEAVAQAHARHHLWQYEQERRAAPPPEDALPLQPHAWRGAVFYALLLLLVPLWFATRWNVIDPYAVGALTSELIRGGEWWRTITALSLHWDAPHLAGNLAAGALLGLSAAQIWGNARAWLLILGAALLANTVEGFAGPGGYASAGASTAVFAALGLVAAFSWRRRAQSHGGVRRWAPLVAGVAVLAMFGAGEVHDAAVPVIGTDAGTNVLSHALGFLAGVSIGAAVASRLGTQLLQRIPVWVAASLALGAVPAAWGWALLRLMQ
jgi:rhomboid protease GluP